MFMKSWCYSVSMHNICYGASVIKQTITFKRIDQATIEINIVDDIRFRANSWLNGTCAKRSIWVVTYVPHRSNHHHHHESPNGNKVSEVWNYAEIESLQFHSVASCILPSPSSSFRLDSLLQCDAMRSFEWNFHYYHYYYHHQCKCISFNAWRLRLRRAKKSSSFTESWFVVFLSSHFHLLLLLLLFHLHKRKAAVPEQ